MYSTWLGQQRSNTYTKYLDSYVLLSVLRLLGVTLVNEPTENWWPLLQSCIPFLLSPHGIILGLTLWDHYLSHQVGTNTFSHWVTTAPNGLMLLLFRQSVHLELLVLSSRYVYVTVWVTLGASWQVFLYFLRQVPTTVQHCAWIFIDIHANGAATSAHHWPGNRVQERTEWRADADPWNRAQTYHCLSSPGMYYVCNAIVKIMRNAMPSWKLCYHARNYIDKVVNVNVNILFLFL